jgi:dodecin
MRIHPILQGVNAVTDHIYKAVELTGSSPDSIEKAVENAIARASQTLRHLRWFQVTETRGQIENGKIAHWQVTLKVGFTLEG